jgi:hypothetical protein
MRLPIECQLEGCPGLLRSVTQNVSTGGLYFEMDVPAGAVAPRQGASLKFDLTVPPGAGHSPYQGRISGTAELVRCRPVAAATPTSDRCGIAVRFSRPLNLRF